MIELERHIEILLLKNDCVIVPGLGGFIASHIPARYDERDNMFLPPSRTLGFNSKLNINDSLLVQSYAEAYDLSYPDAYARIENEVRELKQHIENDGYYELSDIGTICLNNEGNLEFKPCEAGILTPDLYSLSSFEIKKDIVHSEKQEKSFEVNNILNGSTATITYATSPVCNKTKDNIGVTDTQDACIQEKTPQIKFRVLKSVFAVIVAIITFFAWTSPINNTNKMIQMGYVDSGIIHNLIKRSYNNITKSSINLRSKETKHLETTIKTKSERLNTQKGETHQEDIKNTNNNFCIVLASRVAKKNAEEFVNKLNTRGIKASTLIENNNSIKVIYGKYMTRKEAYNALNELKSNEYFYDAWVYHIK